MSRPEKVFIAADLGASSGRVVAGRLDQTRLHLDELHRFPNGPINVAGHLHWDCLALWQNIQDGLRIAATKHGSSVECIGVDTWGVDFGLLTSNGELVGNPYHYRDARTQGTMASVFETISREAIFEETGLQFMELNTLYQLWAMNRANSPLLAAADSFLMMPDLFHWLMTGEKANEFTNATTTQFYNPRTRSWANRLLEQLNLSTNILGEIVPPGTVLGRIRKDVSDATGIGRVQIVLPGTHDTASAVMAVPAESNPGESLNWCYISSGTWSLMGVETANPIINDRCRELNFTNEGGVGGTIRVLKNIAGLWLVQECRRIWKQEGKSWSWDQLVAAAEQATELRSVIDPDDSSFVAPQSMPEAIRVYCQRKGQEVPQDEGAMIRCILEGLALRYRAVLGWLEELLGHRIETIHIVGGGSKNRLLCQLAADACNRIVVAGPIEATAIGNITMQAVASKELGSIQDARALVRESFPLERYEPRRPLRWDEAFQRFQNLTSSHDGE